MYKVREITHNITAFDCKSNTYAYISNEKKYINLNSIIEEKKECPIEILSRKDFLYVWYSSVGKFEFYQGNKIINTLDRDVVLLDINHNFYVGRSILDLTTFESYYNLINPYDGSLILEKNIPYNLYVNEEIIVAYNNFKGEIKRIKTDTTNIWQFPLSSLGADPYEPNKNDEISKILGVVYGNLWLTTKAERIVALDVNTGEKKYQNEGFGVYLDEKSQNIFSIASNIIEIINTRTLSIEERFNFLEADPKGIGKYEYVYSPLLQGDYFTFLGRMPNDSDVFRAGIFDYKARKLVWEHQFISEEEYEQTRNHLLLPQPLYMSGNKLYIKDFKNNLHIYEKEEPNCKTNL